MNPRHLKLPDRAFKVKFKIFRFGFTDFEMFVRHFVDGVSWKIASLSDNTHTYVLENGWNITLHAHGDISLYSPLLEREQAVEVYRVIDVLIAMDVRVGENCEVEMHYEGSLPGQNGMRFLSGVPIYLLAAAAFALFVGIETAQFMYFRPALPAFWLGSEIVAFGLALLFGWILYTALARNRQRYEDVLKQASREWAHEDFMRNEDVRRKMHDPSAVHAKDLINEISLPLESIMAYTRFYSSHSQQETQHWKDLMEIMDQATRIREVMNRIETRLVADGELPDHVVRDKKLFRKSSRRMDLIALTVRGADLLGEPFETPSYALNISESGVCLLLPDGLVKVGQTIHLENHNLSMAGVVRWVVESKSNDLRRHRVLPCPDRGIQPFRSEYFDLHDFVTNH